MTFEDRARVLHEGGTDLDEVLARPRAEGASIVDCVKVVRAVEGIPLGEAKRIVDASPAWASHREGNRRLRARSNRPPAGPAALRSRQQTAHRVRARTPHRDGRRWRSPTRPP
ncbi:hypothetical protein CCE01nite_09990 [Cellulomonas cellasea]|uniref:Uncharacterized protein n=1 Tax=Cellulomonas cellasea TaxID=43670 RepID=A0A4Y3KVW4_9CELL|nr:hypothetical protein CCE01nite_09990 [Cellulomonas cellasea]